MSKTNQFENMLCMDKSISENFAQNNRKSRISDFGIFFGAKLGYEIFVKRFFKKREKKNDHSI